MNADAPWNDDPERAELERKKALLKRLKNDRRYYISKFLKIKTRDSRIIYLDPNEAQNRFLLMVEGQERAGKPVRGVCLKPRRVGMSTGIQAMMFQRAATHSNINGLTVAHDLDSTQELFEMDGLFYDELPEDIRPLKRFCVDAKTECLTREGWKNYDWMVRNEKAEIYTLNPKTLSGEWHKPDIWVGLYTGTMIEWSGEDIDAVFTPEHKWFLMIPEGKPGFYTHDSAPRESLIPVSCPTCGSLDSQRLSRLKKRKVPYSGVIWCPSVPTHTWLARRNGKIYITGNSNRKEIVFENPDEVSRRVYPGLRSKLRVATSSDEELGRSKEIHLLHCSEVGFWDKADTTMLSLCNAVSGNPHTMIFKESTPNGVGNYFYKEYKLAKSGQSDYFAYFMAWFEFHAHQKALLVPVEEFEDSINDEEKKLREKYSLTLEQLNWRRWAIRELCGGDKEKFNQEYPADDVSCFLLSGRHYFDGELIQKLLMGNLYEPAFRGNLLPSRNILGFNLEPNDKGFLKIWKPPAMGRRYILAADVAEGLEHGDFSVGNVHDWETFDLCASWHGHIASDLFGDELANLGNLYNRALIACEDNIGTPNKRLLRLGYPHLFYRQELDDRVKRRTQKLGWLTTHITKPVMLNDLQQLLRDGAEIPDQELVDEIATFIYKPDGSLGGESNCFDDRVIASSIAAAVRNSWGIGRFFPKS